MTVTIHNNKYWLIGHSNLL